MCPDDSRALCQVILFGCSALAISVVFYPLSSYLANEHGITPTQALFSASARENAGSSRDELLLKLYDLYQGRHFPDK